MKTIQAIKRLPIRTYLAERGLYPTKDNPRYGLYLSPLRKEHTPSFKVDYMQNLWYDFGLGAGGSIIDLVMRLERCNFTEAVQLLSCGERTSIAVPVSPSVLPTVPALRMLFDIPLRHSALVGYLSSRGIDPAIASACCREVHYTVGGRNYFAVGFRNDASGWELRSECFKGCVSPKQITTIDNRSDTVVAFEGFMDFLSYLSMENQLQTDAAVLNSVVNLPKAIPFLDRHTTIHAFFDNDEAGRKATADLKRLCPNSSVIDRSHLYRKHKDLNEYWQAKQSRLHIAPQRKRGMKM
ncbi:MAG TPA: toprim domain-containing protein [Alistipes sp.]|uniref:toprim domain-containing protein n=1 Tax=unclassified Alistipes TaxID=2608932 RepID=UPI00258479E4|nr:MULTISPECIES: toprim domain-containing protein [unclassified Alistipes]HUN13470.1 toprim domain-containing protein [Alistipes sp.]